MKKLLVVSVMAVAAVAMIWSSAPAGGLKLSDSVLKMKATLDKSATAGKAVVTLTIDIDKGWHLYANPVGSEDLADSQLVVEVKNAPKAVIEYPKGKVVEEESIGKFKIYEGKIDVRATFDRAADDKNPIELNVKVSSCSDKKCLKPTTVKVTVP